MTKRERWREALKERNQLRQEQRNKIIGRDPIIAPTHRIVPKPQQQGNMMVRRGNDVVSLSHKQASRTTAKSWKTRKQQFGRVGRASKLTFKKK